MRARLKFVLTAVAVLWLLKAAPAEQAAEPSALTLQHAVKIALEKNPLRKAALADTSVASADVREARSVLMPRLTRKPGRYPASRSRRTRGHEPPADYN